MDGLKVQITASWELEYTGEVVELLDVLKEAALFPHVLNVKTIYGEGE